MIRDPLYREIRRRLRDLKDGDAFEMCTNYLLSKIFPSIAPREGGDDAGLDGLIAKQDGGSIQLICTTGEDVLDNLSNSIEANIKKGGQSRSCIFATSKRLTNAKKRTLEARAKKLRRELIQIYDQAAIAQLLYREPRWLQELLGLTGNPPPLSLFPITSRPLFDVLPVGRDEDISKIIAGGDDLVVIGQPGSGKTHLLFTAAKRAKGRFIVDEDLGRIADGARSIQPNFLIVDDAHSRLDLLKRLRHLKQEIGANFKIVASCWPGHEDAVGNALQTSKRHTLEGLAQKQIKEIVHSQKILGPEHLVAEIIHQAQGKPGLAVTLCRLCWESGDARDVVLGTALARDVKLSFEPLLGEGAIHLLACFSIGGSAGMTLESVARLLNKNVLEIKRTTEQLAAAGVLDFLQNRISVHPLRLRQALVRDVFLTPPVVDLSPYLAETPDFASTTCILIEGKLMGGTVSDQLLRSRLEILSTTYEQTSFEEYAYLGPSEAEWVLETYPEKLKAVAKVALQTTPEETLQMLLDYASRDYDERKSQGQPTRDEDILPEIKQWIFSAKPNHNDAFKRRELLATSLEKWFVKNEKLPIAVQVAELALSIRHENTSTPAGEPMTVTFHFGLIAQDYLSKIAALWPKIFPILSRTPPAYSKMSDFFHDWVFPSFRGTETPKEYEAESRLYAKRMISDLLATFSADWTMHHKLRRHAQALGLCDAIKTDEIAEVLYPSREPDDWREAQKQQRAAADKLAENWSLRGPIEIVPILVKIELQSRAAEIFCMSLDAHVCSQIAKATDKLEIWTQTLFKHNAPPHLIEPFLDKLAETDPVVAAPWILTSLELPVLQGLGVLTVIKHFDTGSPLWEKASPYFKQYAYQIGMWVLQARVKESNLKNLLQFLDSSVASAVAINLWRDESTTEIHPEILADWKEVVVEHVEKDYVLQGIFKKYPDVAFKWIERRLDGIRDGTKAFWFGSKYDHAIPIAIQMLTLEQKRDLMDKLPRSSATADLARALVGRDIELYVHLLSREELGKARLDPLRLDYDFGSQTENAIHELDEGWQKMAIAALDKGFSEADIFAATQAGGFGWSGSMSSMFAARLVPFENLLNHPHPRLKTIAKIGYDHFVRRRDEQLAYEKRAAIRGEF